MCHLSRYYKCILGKLELAKCDFDELRQRGLSAKAMEEIGFKTLTRKMNVPYTKIAKGEPQWFAYYPSGMSMLIPARNVDGHIVACQQKPHSKSPKYKWISTEDLKGVFRSLHDEQPSFFQAWRWARSVIEQAPAELVVVAAWNVLAEWEHFSVFVYGRVPDSHHSYCSYYLAVTRSCRQLPEPFVLHRCPRFIAGSEWVYSASTSRSLRAFSAANAFLQRVHF